MKRIRFFALILSPCSVSAAWGQQKATTCVDNWNQFGRDNMQRWNPCETVLNIGNVGNLQLKWEFTTHNPITASPAVENGAIYINSWDGHLYALNAKTGAQIWSYSSEYAYLSSPAVANGLVYTGSLNGDVYALDTSTGAQVWSYGTTDRMNGGLAVADGTVYAGAGEPDYYYVALDATTGALQWKFDAGGGTGQTPSVVGGRAYISDEYTLSTLDAYTGAVLWTHNFGDVVTQAAVADGAVFLGADTTVYALNAATGAVLWSYNTSPYVATSMPAVADGVVFVGTAGVYGSSWLYALSASTGAVMWSHETCDEGFNAPAVANGVVYAISSYCADEVALDAATGAVLWSRTPGILNTSVSPVVTHGMVYFGDGTHIYAFGLPSKKK
jgi:eukaryotic-like serine/threonine-protein kinase